MRYIHSEETLPIPENGKLTNFLFPSCLGFEEIVSVREVSCWSGNVRTVERRTKHDVTRNMGRIIDHSNWIRQQNTFSEKKNFRLGHGTSLNDTQTFIATWTYPIEQTHQREGENIWEME